MLISFNIKVLFLRISCKLSLIQNVNNHFKIGFFYSRKRFIVLIANSNTSSEMIFPIPHTNPAEFMFAVFASHMHATTVLFNVDSTLRTWLGIFLNPISTQSIFILSSNFGFPFRIMITTQWSMSNIFTLRDVRIILPLWKFTFAQKQCSQSQRIFTGVLSLFFFFNNWIMLSHPVPEHGKN